MTIKQRLGHLILAISPISPEVAGTLRVEFRAFRNRLNFRFNPVKRKKIANFRSLPNISLNVGCGPFGQDGWVNIDLMKLQNVSFTFDTRRRLPFKNDTVDRIRVEHFFEHLDKNFEVPKFIEECRRIMKSGAVLRIVVPDAALFIEAYVNNDRNLWAKLGYDVDNLPPHFDTKIAILNHIFRQDGEHKYAYDFEAMQYVLQASGFKNIIKQAYRKSLDQQLIDDQGNHSGHSLYVECVK